MNHLLSVGAAVPRAALTARVLPGVRALPWDPRIYQIATLAGLLGYGIWWLDLEIQPQNAVAIIATVLATQLVCTALAARGPFDPRSALISGLSLCLLLRTGSLDLAMLTA